MKQMMPSPEMPRIDDVAFQAAFALRHGFTTRPGRSASTACATPPDIAAAGAAAVARQCRTEAAAQLHAGNEEAAHRLVEQADLADRLAEGWQSGRAHYCPALHQPFHDRGLAVLRARQRGHGRRAGNGSHGASR